MSRSSRQGTAFPAVTQKMVAQRAGVSQAAVSHILGGAAKRYNEQTCERVRGVAAKMGYQPSRAAQIMRTGRSNTVVHLNYGGYSELAGQKTYHLGRFIHEAGFDYEVIDSYWWPEVGAKIINRILSLHPEGLIVSGSLQTDVDFSPLQRAGIPIVAIEANIPHASLIRHDIRSAMATLTRACLAQGRMPSILLKQLPTEMTSPYWTISARKDGFLDALREAGIPHVEEFTVGGKKPENLEHTPAIFWSTKKPDPTKPFANGEQAAQWLLENDCVPKALLCTNDFYAICVMREFQAAGLRVPEDMVLTGFDNLSFAALQSVSLTTVEQPLEAMCAKAVAFLKNHIDAHFASEKAPEVKFDFPCQIHWRRTLASGDAALAGPSASIE